jgi:hypothetical protein
MGLAIRITSEPHHAFSLDTEALFRTTAFNDRGDRRGKWCRFMLNEKDEATPVSPLNKVETAPQKASIILDSKGDEWPASDQISQARKPI